MRDMTITVIIPAYQASKTIGRAIESVVKQSRPPEEILVVNDGSSDGLMSALQPYRNRVFLLSKSNGGAASARNHGINYATGDLIAFLDADDTWEPRKLEQQWNLLTQYPEVGLIAGRFYEQEESGTPYESMPICRRRMDRVIRANGSEAMEMATRIWTSTVLVRRSVLGNERFVAGLEPAEDRDLWFRIISMAPVYLTSQLLAIQHLTPGSLSRSNLDVDCANMLRVIDRHADRLGETGARRWRAHCYRRWAGNHLAQGRPGAALEPACARMALQPYSLESWWVLLKAIREVHGRMIERSTAYSGVSR